MVLCVKVKREEAKKVKKKLIEKRVMNTDYKPEHSKDFVFFPVKEKVSGLEVIERELERVEKPKNLKEELKKIMSEEEIKKLVTSFDVIGDIAIIEIPKELESKERLIGEAILHVHKNVKVVCKRAGIHSGVFRVRPVKIIAGENRTTTVYKESGAVMKLDVSKVYFSPRLSFERSRIASLVKPGEVIGAWFAGVGPFPLVIFKKQPRVKIYAIELNPDAFKYLEENIRINKAQEAIIPVLGDVREKVKNLPLFDRVIMPLPKGGEDFLELAFERVKQGGVIHFYHFVPKEGAFEKTKQVIKEKACGKKVGIISMRRVRDFSPSMIQVVADIKAFKYSSSAVKKTKVL